jgi:hypothetical protein
MFRLERVIVDECVGQQSPLVGQLRQRLSERPVKFVFLATKHPGIPDVEILDKLLEGLLAAAAKPVSHTRGSTDGENTVFQRTVARCLQLLALSLAVMPSVVCAQGEPHMGSPQQQGACRADVLRHCRGVHEDIAIANCLKANAPKLHLACRQIVEDGTR